MSDVPIQSQTIIETPSRKQIEEFAQHITREFHPQRIILFGSHARGDTTADSDVDLLVIMPRNGKTAHQQAAEIYYKCRSPFPTDILVRTAEEFEQRQHVNDWFMRDIAQEGITLYEARNG